MVQIMNFIFIQSAPDSMTALNFPLTSELMILKICDFFSSLKLCKSMQILTLPLGRSIITSVTPVTSVTPSVISLSHLPHVIPETSKFRILDILSTITGLKIMNKYKDFLFILSLSRYSDKNYVEMSINTFVDV